MRLTLKTKGEPGWHGWVGLYYPRFIKGDLLARLEAHLNSLSYTPDRVRGKKDPEAGRAVIGMGDPAWMGPPLSYAYAGAMVKAQPMTAEILELRDAILPITTRPGSHPTGPNYVHLNYYHDGVGIGWHSDKRDTMVPLSDIVSVSFAASRRFQIRKRYNSAEGEAPTPIHTILLAPGDVVIMRGTFQEHFVHRVPPLAKAALVNVTTLSPQGVQCYARKNATLRYMTGL
jgi:alkylated DNA repair dioxygenase AlkB